MFFLHYKCAVSIVPQLVDEVGEGLQPLAAGGIADGRGMAVGQYFRERNELVSAQGSYLQLNPL